MILFGTLITRREAPWALYPSAPRGYIAGEPDPEGAAGDGIVTVNGVPASLWVEVWHQVGPSVTPTTLVATVFSAPDGSYHVPDLPALDYYRVVAIDHTGTWESQIVEGRQPYVPEA